jgi:DNA-binding transcriptional ArsR family regulator
VFAVIFGLIGLAALAASGPATATDLASRLPITRQAIAKHLALLAEAGLVAAEPGERRRVRYRLRSAPMQVAHRESELGRRLGRGDLTGENVIEDGQPPLRASIRGDRFRLHGAEGDKVASRLWMTKSLAVHTPTIPD